MVHSELVVHSHVLDVEMISTVHQLLSTFCIRCRLISNFIIKLSNHCLQAKAGPSRVEIERLKMEVIENANIVCSTLSFSGSSLLQRISRPFDVVVIDEAAQAVEPATLIPLCSGAKQVLLLIESLLRSRISD